MTDKMTNVRDYLCIVTGNTNKFHTALLRLIEVYKLRLYDESDA